MVGDLGRHAVLKHVGVLEAAALITTTKDGRVRRCHLNAVPLVELAQRWLDDYALHFGGALIGLRNHLETPEEPMTLVHRHSVVVDATPARVWTALLDENASWYFGTTLNVERADGLPVVGADYTYTYPDGTVAAEGSILVVEPERRLEMTFSPVWDDDVRDEPPCRLAWVIELVDGTTMVSVEHHDLDPESHTAQQMDGGSVYLVSNLKTWLETGAPMPA